MIEKIPETEFSVGLNELAERHGVEHFLFLSHVVDDEMLIVANGISKPAAIELLLRTAQSLADDVPGFELKLRRVRSPEDGKLL